MGEVSDGTGKLTLEPRDLHDDPPKLWLSIMNVANSVFGLSSVDAIFLGTGFHLIHSQRPLRYGLLIAWHPERRQHHSSRELNLHDTNSIQRIIGARWYNHYFRILALKDSLLPHDEHRLIDDLGICSIAVIEDVPGDSPRQAVQRLDVNAPTPVPMPTATADLPSFNTAMEDTEDNLSAELGRLTKTPERTSTPRPALKDTCRELTPQTPDYRQVRIFETPVIDLDTRHDVPTPPHRVPDESPVMTDITQAPALSLALASNGSFRDAPASPPSAVRPP
eukprot:5459610-Pyramimonas_sp.AAC.1